MPIRFEVIRRTRHNLTATALPVATLVLMLAVSGCASRHPVASQSVGHVVQHQASMPAMHHQALPSGGFASQVQTPLTQVPETAIDPTENFSPPVPQVVNGFQTAASQTNMLDAWEQFQNPHLRILQETALTTSVQPDEIVARLSESAEYGGLGLGRSPMRSVSDSQRMLMQRVAEAFVDIRMYQQLLTDCYLQLKVQRDALEYAEQRKEEGKAGKLDVIALSSQIGFTESAMSPIRTELRDALKRMAVLTGQEMTPPRIKSLSSQRQLHLPELDDRLPASVLRQRCDVRHAEQQIATIASSNGVGEAALLPHLALEGELTAKYSDSRKKRDRDDEFGLNLGDKETWGFVTPNAGAGQSSNLHSPLQQSMSSYQNTVMSAASDVETLLTEYHSTLHEVRKLELAVEDSHEAMRLVLQQFETDRTDGNVVAATAKRMSDLGQSLPRARARLSAIAIELFKAIGGECNLDSIPTASFYHQLDQSRQ